MPHPVVIHGIYISPGHSFYWREPGSPADYEMQSLSQAECVAGKGLRGDRFFDFKQDFKGQVTFFSAEVLEAVRDHVGGEHCPPWATRRNILLSGFDLNRLIGCSFSIGEVMFEGSEECAPCDWMDHAIGHGAREFLRGQGGLRARILESGTLLAGPGTLSLESG